MPQLEANSQIVSQVILNNMTDLEKIITKATRHMRILCSYYSQYTQAISKARAQWQEH